MRLLEHVGPASVIHEVLSNMTHHDDEICHTRGYVVDKAVDPLNLEPRRPTPGDLKHLAREYDPTRKFWNPFLDRLGS